MVEPIGTFKEALALDLKHSQMRPKAIAEELMCKDYTYLRNAANPNCERHNLRADFLSLVTNATGQCHALSYEANKCGKILVDVPEVPSGPEGLYAHLSEVSKEFADVVRAFGEATDPNGPGGCEATRAEKAIFERELMELLQKTAGALEALRASEGGRDE